MTAFPPAASFCVDDNIAERVTQALWADPFVEPANIVVRVDAGVVVLTGSVATESQRYQVLEVLEGLYCCDDVILDLHVTARDNLLSAA